MFAVKIDLMLEEHRSKIIYALDYLFSVAGYSYRLLEDSEVARSNEVLFYYTGSKQEIGRYLSGSLSGFSICVLYDGMHYDYSEISADEFDKYLQSMNIGYELPYLCSRKLDEPISLYYDKKHGKFYVGLINFDLLGNLFFHLTSSEEDIFDKRDEHGRYLWQESPFRKYYQQPFLMGLVNILELFLSEGEKYLQTGLIKIPLWPGSHQYAAVLSHSVDTLEKWKVKRFFKGIFGLLASFHRIGYHFRNIASFINFIFRNWEPYWNFDLVSALEKKYGFISTFFFGVKGKKKKIDFDYSLKEADLNKQKNELVESGHDLGLLANYNLLNKDAYVPQTEAIDAFAGRHIKGVRQHLCRYEPNRNSFYYTNAGLEWDSSRTMIDMRGFISGIGYPYYQAEENYWQPTVLELPVTFSERSLKTGTNSYLSHGQIVEEVKDLIDQARKFKSMFVIDTSLASFEEIPYLIKFYEKTLSKISSDPTVWKTSFNEVHDWIERRKNIKIRMEGNKIIINFVRGFDELTLFIKGYWHVIDIADRLLPKQEQEELDIFSENTWWKVGETEMQVIGRMLQFKNINDDTTIELEIEKIGK